MYFQHIYETGLAQASYLIGCQATGEAVVIDPRRDIDVYLEAAEKNRLRITHIAETHIHADFLSGSRELAAATGATMYLSDEGGADWAYQFDHVGLRDGDQFTVGNLRFDVLHTPGHTPEHISFLLTDLPASAQPVMLFSGDFVFVGDVGRPDLLEKAAGVAGTRVQGARDMFRSLRRFTALPDHVQLWPGHGAGSACGKALGAVPSSTVGYEKLTNWALRIEDEETFITELLAGQPEPPRYFAMMKRLNKVGPRVLGGVPHPARLTLTQFTEAMTQGLPLIDTRDKLAFAGGHFPGSLNIQNNSAFSTWAGWMLEYGTPFLLVASDSRIAELTRALIRIGLDDIAGYVSDMDRIGDAGHDMQVVDQITVDELYAHRDEYLVLDVRGATEHAAARIPGSRNIHAGVLAGKLDELPRDRRMVVHCVSGDRSSIATSFLLAKGFTQVRNLTCGINGWMQRGYDVERGGASQEDALAA
ncbi:MAG: rhodanese-like domain-containing protein [Bacteroidota bacterium]|jgi:hydroxyacylglutathione hydrolase|nr:rhodanese-like domain-containing protein [Bacteroidota bacterium]